MEREKSNSNSSMSVVGLITRFITSAIILAVTAFFTPGFEISSFWSLIVAAIVLTLIDYLVNTIVGSNLGAFGNGVIGFIVSAIMLYITQFFVTGYSITWLSAFVCPTIYGIVASFVPGKQNVLFATIQGFFRTKESMTFLLHKKAENQRFSAFLLSIFFKSA